MQSTLSYTHRVDHRSRSLKITLSPTGEVIVTTPRFIPKFAINAFVQKSREWIEKHQHLQKRRTEQTLGKLKNEILYFGVPYEVHITKHAQHAVHIERAQIIVCPVSLTQESFSKALVRWMKAEAQRYIVSRAHEMARKLHLDIRSIVFRDQSSRWGSCSTNKHLNFNWRLIQAPKEVIDYVIMHELAHLVHMNHSERFWAYVEHVLPDFQVHRKWLRLHGAVLHQDFKLDAAVRDTI